MRKIIFIMLIACVAFIGCKAKEAEASGRRHSKTTIIEADEGYSVAGVKIDAPDLVKITKDGLWTLGAEGGKDILKDIFHGSDSWVEADRGYFAYVKVTYKGCLLNCSEE